MFTALRLSGVSFRQRVPYRPTLTGQQFIGAARFMPRTTGSTAKTLTRELPTKQFGTAQARCGPEIEAPPIRKAMEAVSTSHASR